MNDQPILVIQICIPYMTEGTFIGKGNDSVEGATVHSKEVSSSIVAGAALRAFRNVSYKVLRPWLLLMAYSRLGQLEHN